MACAAAAENDVFGRLFQRLEQCIGRFLRQHVNLVDDVNFEAPLRRHIADVVAQLAHVVDPAVARCVQLDDIETVSAGDLPAIIAFPTRPHSGPVDTIERFGQNAGRRSFPCPARPDKKIGVGQAILLNRILERAGDVRLPDDIVKRLGPVFAGKNLVAHPKTLAFMASRER